MSAQLDKLIDPKRGLDRSVIKDYTIAAKSAGLDAQTIKAGQEDIDQRISTAAGESNLPKGKVCFLIHPRDGVGTKDNSLGRWAVASPYGPSQRLREDIKRNGNFYDIQHHYPYMRGLDPKDQIQLYSRLPVGVQAAYTKDGNVIGYVLSLGLSLGRWAETRVGADLKNNFKYLFDHDKGKKIATAGKEAAAEYVNRVILSDLYRAFDSGLLARDAIIGLSMTLPGPTNFGATIKQVFEDSRPVTGHELTSLNAYTTRLRLNQDLGLQSEGQRVGFIGLGLIGNTIMHRMLHEGKLGKCYGFDYDLKRANKVIDRFKRSGFDVELSESRESLFDNSEFVVTAINGLSPVAHSRELRGKPGVDDSNPTYWFNADESPIAGVVATLPSGISRVSVVEGKIMSKLYDYGASGLVNNGVEACYPCELQAILGSFGGVGGEYFHVGPVNQKSENLWTNLAQSYEVGTPPFDLQYRGKKLDYARYRSIWGQT